MELDKFSGNKRSGSISLILMRLALKLNGENTKYASMRM